MTEFRGDELLTRGKAVRTRADFEEFLRLLVQNNKEQPDEWEHTSIGDFLDAMNGFVRDIEGYYRNARCDDDPETPSWKMFAEILLASRVYE